nr:catalase family protein [Paracoccaceae bacterium]
LGNLLPELAQGLFAEPRRYPAIARLSHVPGEFLDDRRVSTPRGMVLKVLDVDGPMLPAHEGERTQDFVLDTGKAFIVSDAKSFLAAITATEMATPAPESVKAAVSTASRATNAALNAVGINSANLDFYGHPFTHPLTEIYYSQCPVRFGDYIAKLAVKPDMPAPAELALAKFEPEDEDGLRTAVTAYFRSNPAEFAVGVQLCTDPASMPIEDASADWPENANPYRIVARLVLPEQDAFTPERQAFLEEALSFSPSHSLAAHRPLGSIMRARMHVYRELSRRRAEANGQLKREISSSDELAALSPAATDPAHA